MSTLNFCTLFDRNYLARGLSLHASLAAHTRHFHLYIFAFDQDCYDTLQALQLAHVTVISLAEFEDEALLRVKPTRTVAEYCWTSTPSTILYCIEHFQLEHCTYIDADMVFYHDPRVLIDAMETDDVLISKHDYTPLYDQSAYSGIYCVQFMCFKHTQNGLAVLRWWRAQCLDWCYARHEDGKFGDQKYLDDWTTRFEGVSVMQHPGGGVAPWNMQQYELEARESKWWVRKDKQAVWYPLVFFHFHGLAFHTDGMVTLTGPLYYMPVSFRSNLYIPYVQDLMAQSAALQLQGFRYDSNGARRPATGYWQRYRQFIREHLSAFLRDPQAILDPRHLQFQGHNHLVRLYEAHQKTVNSRHG
jgi:hypothetical protein